MKKTTILMISIVVCIIIIIDIVIVLKKIQSENNNIITPNKIVNNLVETEDLKKDEIEYINKNEQQSIESKSTWTQNGIIVTNGIQTLKVGDAINYDETKGGTIDVPKNVEWKVLGALNGEVLIMSNTNVAKSGYYLIDTEGYKYGIDQLNIICFGYGDGIGATGSSRSINVEDINRVTQYNPKNQKDGTIYGQGEVYQYGNKVTYSITREGCVKYKSATKSGDASQNFGFLMYNGEELTEDTDITIESTGYEYEGSTYLQDEDAYKMLFDSGNYWVASQFVSADEGYVTFSLYRVLENGLRQSYLYDTRNARVSGIHGVRAVVSLEADTVLSRENDNLPWDLSK